MSKLLVEALYGCLHLHSVWTFPIIEQRFTFVPRTNYLGRADGLAWTLKQDSRKKLGRLSENHNLRRLFMERKNYCIFILGLVFGFLITFSQPTWASEHRSILTEGTGTVTGQNDSAKLTIAILSEGRDLVPTSSENASKTKAVLGAIKKLEIKGLKLKTAGYRVTPQKDFKSKPPRLKGYEVFNAVEITLEGFQPEDLAVNVSTLVGKALEMGANHVQNLFFYIKNKGPYEKVALTLATREAIERAKILAEAAGVKIKGITTISTQPIHEPIRPHVMRSAAVKAEAAAMEPPIDAGESKIHVRVHVAHEIE